MNKKILLLTFSCLITFVSTIHMHAAMHLPRTTKPAQNNSIVYSAPCVVSTALPKSTATRKFSFSSNFEELPSCSTFLKQENQRLQRENRTLRTRVAHLKKKSKRDAKNSLDIIEQLRAENIQLVDDREKLLNKIHAIQHVLPIYARIKEYQDTKEKQEHTVRIAQEAYDHACGQLQSITYNFSDMQFLKSKSAIREIEIITNIDRTYNNLIRAQEKLEKTEKFLAQLTAGYNQLNIFYA